MPTADDTTSTLARTGNVVAAASVGTRDTANAVTSARRTVTDSVSAAAQHIRSSVRGPRTAATNTRYPSAHRFVDRVVHRAVHPAMNAAHADDTAQ
jgi:C4-dicarboxylate-specific signal transduction histidine kinase